MRRYMGIRWITIVLIMMGAMVNFLSRATLSVAAPTVMQDLSITTQEYGWITSAFQFCIMLQPVVGYIIDILGVKTGFAIFAFAWSVICMAHGFATNWQMLAFFRGALGFAEGAFSPGGLKVVSEWFPAKERGLAGGLYNIGPSIGQMLAPPLVVWAILYFGNWQISFVIVGAISLSWVVLWMLFYHPVATHPKLSAEERELITSGQENYLLSDDKKPSITSILKRRNFWGIALPRFLTDPTWGMLSFWVPLYLTQVRGFDLKQIAMYAWLPFLAADLGCVFGPGVVLFLQKRGWDLIDARRLHGRRLFDDRRRLHRHRAKPHRRRGAAQPGGFRAPDAVGDHDHHGHRPVPPQRSRHRRRHGGHLRQSGHLHHHADHRRAGQHHRLYAVLHRPGGAGPDRRRRRLDCHPKANRPCLIFRAPPCTSRIRS